MAGILAVISVTACSLLAQQVMCAAPNTLSRAADLAVLEKYRRMEEADRKGDGVLWLALRDRATLGAMSDALKETIRKGGHSRPRIQYEAAQIRTSGLRSVVLGKVTDPDTNTVQYDAVLFV